MEKEKFKRIPKKKKKRLSSLILTIPIYSQINRNVINNLKLKGSRPEKGPNQIKIDLKVFMKKLFF